MEQITNVPRLKKRAKDAHKGNFGKSARYRGQLRHERRGRPCRKSRLADRFRPCAGGGAQKHFAYRRGIEPCYTTIPLPEDDKGHISAKAVNTILDAIADNDVVAFGPGVGFRSRRSDGT